MNHTFDFQHIFDNTERGEREYHYNAFESHEINIIMKELENRFKSNQDLSAKFYKDDCMLSVDAKRP